MSCKKIQEQIAQCFDAESPLDAALEAHAAGCPGCRGKLDALEALSAALNALPAEEIPTGLESRAANAMRDARGLHMKLRWSGLAFAALLIVTAGSVLPAYLDTSSASATTLELIAASPWLENFSVAPSALLAVQDWGRETLALLQEAALQGWAWAETRVLSGPWASSAALAGALLLLTLTNGFAAYRARGLDAYPVANRAWRE